MQESGVSPRDPVEIRDRKVQLLHERIGNSISLAAKRSVPITTRSDPTRLSMNRAAQPASCSLRRERTQVGRDGDDVVLGKAGDGSLHQRHGGAGTRSVLHADEL